MGTYRKKPVVIEAVQYVGNGPTGPIFQNGENPEWVCKAMIGGTLFVDTAGRLIVKTLEGDHRCDPDDFLIQGVKGELYPCKPDIFILTHCADEKHMMTFGQALEAVKQGQKIARKGWNGKNMFVFLRHGRMITGVDSDSPMGGDFESLPHLCMRSADGKCVVGWLASQTDMLSDDWETIEK